MTEEIKVHTRTVLDMESMEVLEDEFFSYCGPLALCEGEGGDGGDGGGEGGENQTLTLADILPEEMRGENLPGSLKDFASVAIPGKDADDDAVKGFHGKIASVLKSYADTKSMVGGMIKIPGKDAKPEEIAAFRARLGVPEKVEDYKIEAPQLGDKAIFDEGLLKAFVGMAHEKGFTPEQVQTAVNFQAEMIQNQIKAMDKAAEEGVAALKKEFGDDYDGLMEGAELVVSKYFPESAKEKIKQYGIGNDPDFVRGLIAMHKATREAGGLKGLKDGSGADETAKGVQDEIDNLMKSDEYSRGDQKTHEKVAALFVKKQKLLGTYKDNVRSSKGEV